MLTHLGEVEWASGFGNTGVGGQVVTPSTVFQFASLGKPVFAHLLERLATEESRDLSGSNALLQQAVEGAENRRLEEQSDSILFAPLGLATMSYLPSARERLPVGHDRSGSPLAPLDPTEANAGSSLCYSALDYAWFLSHVAGVGDSIPPPWLRLTRRRVVVLENLWLHRGMGWALERQSDGSYAALHWGSNPGFKSFALLDRTRGLGVVILTNGDNGFELIEHLLGILDSRAHRLFECYMLHPDDRQSPDTDRCRPNLAPEVGVSLFLDVAGLVAEAAAHGSS